MNTYTIDLATGEVTQQSAGIRGAATADESFIDPEILKDPEVRRSLGDIYAAIRSRRFVKRDDQPAGQPSANAS